MIYRRSRASRKLGRMYDLASVSANVEEKRDKAQEKADGVGGQGGGKNER